MSFQSLIESGECGAANPVVDLARQFTQSTADPAVLANLDLSTSNLSQNGQTVPAQSAADLLQQSDAHTSPFNMEALLEQMKQMDELFEKTENNDPTAVKNDLLIGNLGPNVEEEFFSEVFSSALNAPEFNQLMSNNLFDNSITANNNWADDYFRQLGEEPTSLLDPQEEGDKQQDILSYRNQPVDEFDSFFSVDSSFSSSNYFKSLPADIGASKEVMGAAAANEALNLKDLVSDQEERLMNMLLSGGNLDTEDVNEIESMPPLSDLQIDQMLNSKETTPTQPQETESDFRIPETLLSSEPQEKFFYENQFDDMEFWMKLAEDWEHSKESDLSNLDMGNPMPIHEPLEKLLNPEHKYHYRFVEENPFLSENQNESSEKADAKTDYIGEGIRRLEMGDIPAAILYFEAAAKTEPDSVKAWRLLGLAQAKNENDRKAIGAMKRCLALQPTNLEALMCLAISFTNESMPNEACQALQEWLRQNSKYQHLVEEAEKAKFGEPNTEQYMGPTPLSKRWATPSTGNIFNNGFFDTVRQCYINAALLSPDEPDADVQCGLGVLFNLSGEYEKAADCFRTAVAVHQEDHTLWNRLGATLANGGNSEEAMSAYREALMRYPGYIRARYNLAISCVLLGAAREAVDHLLGVLNLQTAGSKSVSAPDSTLQELLAQPTQITSSNVWNTLRSVLITLGRNDLSDAVDQRNLDRLNSEFNFQSNQPNAERQDL